MKKIKFVAILTIGILLMCMLAACGSSTYGSGSGGGTRTGTITLKQFLDSGPKVGLIGTPNKSDYPHIYLFENGKIYMVCTWSSYNGFYANDKHGALIKGNDGIVTWGDLAKMTDEELLEFAREHKQLEYIWFGGDYGLIEVSEGFATGEYTLHIYTDSTGNNRSYERIEINYEYRNNDWADKYDAVPFIDKLKSSTEKAVIYDSIFSGLEDAKGNVLYFRTGENLTIVLDNLGDEGVEVD